MFDYNIIEDYKLPAPGEGPFYTDYLWSAQEKRDVGLEYIDWKETKFTYLAHHKDDIIELFNTNFKYRELGAETEMRFQDMLQIRFNEVADKYNHAYKVTEENDVDKLGTGYTFGEKRTRHYEDSAESSGTEDVDNKFKDTPSNNQSTLNNPTNQTLDNTQTSGNGSSTEDEDVTVNQEKTQHDKEMVVELSELIDRYRQLDIEFVKQFEPCFIGLIGVY